MADVKKVIEKVMVGGEEGGEIIKGIYKPRQLTPMGMCDENGKFKPISSLKLNYDAPQSQLETIYYWILDFMKEHMGLKVEKVVDNFTSSPGSGHFAEMGQRVTRMQEEGIKIFGALNQIIKSALNLVYDLKDFRMRLKHYEDYRDAKDEETKQGAFLALKQVWLDNVDLPKRGEGSIHGLASKIGYTTVREAFMVANSMEDLEKMSKGDEAVINEMVARIIQPRLKEFLDWIDFSERELKKRYQIEKSYLKSQIETIKIYSAWVKPYLKAAEELRQKGFDNNAALVHAFSTSMFQLTLIATSSGKKSSKREYLPVIVVNFEYRGHLLQRVNQRGDYAPAVSGKVDMSFDAYALNEEELKLIRKKIKDADLEESLSIHGDYAAEALETLKEDLDEFLNDKEEKKQEKKKVDDINPFSALFSLFSGVKKSSSEKKEIKDAKEIKSDNWKEKQLRVSVAVAVAKTNYLIYDIYKKAHGMASSPEEFINQGDALVDAENAEGKFPTQLSDVWSWDWK